MGTLSAADMIRMRQLTGGDHIGADRPDYLTDDQINAEYTTAGDDFDQTLLPVTRRRWAASVMFVNGSPEFGIEQNREIFLNYERLLKYYEGRFGDSGPVLEVGVIDTDIDHNTTSDDD